MIECMNKTDLWACPKDHPITCGNPAPWRITEIKINIIGTVYIRGQGSLWFRFDNCYVGDYDSAREWADHLHKPESRNIQMRAKTEGWSALKCEICESESVDRVIHLKTTDVCPQCLRKAMQVDEKYQKQQDEILKQ